MFIWLKVKPSEGRAWFLQDGSKVHAATSTKEFLMNFFDDRIILRGLCPRRSPDLTPPDFFLLGYIKDCVFQVEPAFIRHLKELIT